METQLSPPRTVPFRTSQIVVLLVAFLTASFATGCGNERDISAEKQDLTPVAAASVASGDPVADAGTDAASIPAAVAVAGAPAEAAAELARILLHGTTEQERQAALLAALHRSGIAVRDPLENGRVVRAAAAPTQGIAVTIAEVVALERGLRRGHQTPLADIAEVVVQAAAAVDVDLRGLALESLLLDDLRRVASDGTPTQRFWVAFLRDLGRQGAAGQDLLDPELKDQVTLDSVQAGLIMLRLAADVTVTAPRQPAEPTTVASGHAWPEVLLGFAGMSAARAQEALRGDCAMGDMETMVMDAAMAASNSVFGKFLDRIKDALEVSSVSDIAMRNVKWAKAAHAIAGNLLGIVKMFVVGSLTEARLEFVDGAEKLVRTKHRHMDNELKLVRATLRLNADGLQSMNCFRVLLAAAGVDFNVGNDAPVKGSKLHWTITRGGVGKGVARGAAGDPGIIKFEGKIDSVTDEKGQATVMVVGRSQDYTVPESARTVEKPATIRVEYSLKGGDLYQDTYDSLLSLLGGPPAIAIELLQRMVPLGNDFHFPVVDYASDYGIDHVDPQTGIHLLGRKCGGPAGRWEIKFSGNLGGIMQVDGETLVNLNYAGVGTSVTHTRTVLPKEAEGLVEIPPARTRGDARMSPDGMHLLMEPSASDATVKWGGTVYQATPTEAMAIPLQIGAYCSVDR